MADPKKPAADDPPAVEPIYQTPELDPATGAPLDTRFQADTSQEAAASKQSPKSETPKDKDEEDDDDAPKGKERSRRR